MATNKLTEVAGLVAQAVMGAKVKDKDGNDKIVKPDGDANYLDLRDIVAGSSGTGGGDNPENPDNPSAGADYYAGSLADGEITERYLLYQRDETVAEQTGSQTVTLLRDVGSTFNMAGDGATFLVHLQKTVVTKGANGAVTDIELNYDPNNLAKNGYFTTTSPYPIYIKASDLATKKTLSIPINGIGESLSGKNVKVPQLNVTFNGNGTMTFESVTGYDNDGDSAGATGANYDVVVDAIATFSTQLAVAQLPPAVNLFSGSASGEIALSGASDFFENAMDGLEITFDPLLHTNIVDKHRNEVSYNLKDIGIPTSIKVPKAKLIENFEFNGFDKLTPTVLSIKNFIYQSPGYLRFLGYSANTIKILKNAITVNIAVNTSPSDFKDLNKSSYGETAYNLLVTKITPYKN